MLTFALALVLATAPDVSNTYRVEVPKVVKVKKGAPSHATVAVVPAAGAHVSPDAPVSLTVHSGPALKLEKEKLGRPEAKETAQKGVEFAEAVNGTASDKLEGTLTFFICTEKLCERQKREIALAVEVE